MKISHLRNKSIDYARWDACISQSHNQLTYAYSWYLDVVSPDWEALVSENYEFVMPLPVKSRYKIPYLVQPVLTQQLGIFSNQPITESIVKLFIKEIPYFSYELALNECNYNNKTLTNPNYILDLNSNYAAIFAKFSKNTQRNIEKALQSKITIQEKITPEAFITFYFSVDKHYLSPRQPILEKLIHKGLEMNQLELYGVFSEANELIAALCLLISDNRLIYLLPVSNQKGKDLYAMFFLINRLIEKNCNKVTQLDFEGSRIPGIARLYKGFGATEHFYYILKRFRPAFLIRK